MTSIAELLSEARGFLDRTCAHRNEADERLVWGEGSDRVNILEEVDPAEASTQLAEAKRYAAARFDAGFGWIDGPVEYGGRGLTPRARARVSGARGALRASEPLDAHHRDRVHRSRAARARVA